MKRTEIFYVTPPLFIADFLKTYSTYSTQQILFNGKNLHKLLLRYVRGRKQDEDGGKKKKLHLIAVVWKQIQ